MLIKAATNHPPLTRGEQVFFEGAFRDGLAVVERATTREMVAVPPAVLGDLGEWAVAVARLEKAATANGRRLDGELTEWFHSLRREGPGGEKKAAVRRLKLGGGGWLETAGHNLWKRAAWALAATVQGGRWAMAALDAFEAHEEWLRLRAVFLALTEQGQWDTDNPGWGF